MPSECRSASCLHDATPNRRLPDDARADVDGLRVACDWALDPWQRAERRAVPSRKSRADYTHLPELHIKVIAVGYR